MTSQEYLDAIKERLLTDRIVAQFEIISERSTSQDGHLRARLDFTDGARLEFSEYFQLQQDGAISTITYSYHWSDSSGKLIRRWDNTPHFPGLEGFPHHIHAEEESVLPGSPVNISLSWI